VKNRTSYTKNIVCFPLENQEVNTIHSKKDTCFKLLTPEIAYLLPGTIKNSYLPELMSRITGTKGLIIDLRRYPSDFIVFTLGRYLMPTATPFVKFSTTNNHLPGLFTYTEPLKVGEYNPDYYKGKIVILVNEYTQSQGEYTTMAFRVAPGAIVLGSTTAGADGNVSSFFLPGGISTLISGIGVYYPDGRETQRIGIVPDIVLKPTIKGIREGRDELIEKAIEIINLK
jgi:C-terminal processing protease CtpA/Prc